MLVPASRIFCALAATWLDDLLISCLISLADSAERSESERISLATTAKPLPDSPARGRLDRCVERQDIGLKRHAVDEFDNFAHALGAVLHGFNGRDGASTSIGQVSDLSGLQVGMADRVCIGLEDE